MVENRFRKVEFLLSAPDMKHLPPDQGKEVAFAGCSNVGKSSTLNLLTDHHKLARTSRTPGRTQTINLFTIDAERRLVDLPGYGYAEAPEAIRIQWQRSLDSYLRERACLCGIVLVIDIRTPLKLFERQMIEWCVKSEVPIHLVLNKADKLSKSAMKNTELRVKKALELYEGMYSLQLLSTKEKWGLETLLRVLDAWYGF